MAITIDGDSGVSGVNGSATTPALQGTDSNTGIVFGTDTVQVATNGSTRATVNSSGQIGIGTTSPTKPLTIDSSTDQIRLSDGSGGFELRGGNVFKISDDGTERIRVDGDGRLLIGTAGESAFASSASAKLQVRATSDAPQIVLGRNDSTATSGETLGILSWYGNDGGSYQECASVRALVDADHANNDKPSRLAFYVCPDNSATLAERMRIKNDGQTLIHGTSSNGVLNLNSSQSASESNNVLVVQHSASSITGGTAACVIFANGNIKNSNNFYGSLSDAKLKENIVDASSQWDDIKAIQVRNYNFKESTGQETHRQLGVVAQELETVSPGLVSDSPDLDADGNDLGTVTKSVNYSVLYMKAVKALQEAQTRIETLETQYADLLARVTALEAA